MMCYDGDMTEKRTSPATNHEARPSAARSVAVRSETLRRATPRGPQTVTLARRDPRHGTENAYTNYSCRCGRCTRAHRIYFTTGPGYRSVQRFRAKRIAAGLTTSTGEPRKVPFRRRVTRVEH